MTQEAKPVDWKRMARGARTSLAIATASVFSGVVDTIGSAVAAPRPAVEVQGQPEAVPQQQNAELDAAHGQQRVIHLGSVATRQ